MATTPDPALQRPSLLANWTSVAGAVLATAAFFAAASLIAIDAFRGFRNPYLGILTYLVAPAFLVAGILLVVLGAALERRRRRRLAPGAIPRFPRVDLNVARDRRAVIVVSAAIIVFLLFTALGTYRTYQFTESARFCGVTCHSVMKPEYTAYLQSPHARVACVECHIGPGATWFVKSKLSGAYQVYATLADRYPRPIPAPIDHLRPAQETCEQCHWPRQFYGAAERVFRHRLADERNTPWTVRMLVDIGGGDPRFGPASGIHWHMDIANLVEYVAVDRERQSIPWVRITDRAGKVTVYTASEGRLGPAQLASATVRRFDCVDCHNRPTHIYRSPVDSVELAMSMGAIDPRLPFVKKQAVLALTGRYASTDAAIAEISRSLTAFYRARPPDVAQASAAALARTIAEVQRIYRQNFFPEMKVDWRTYADNVGHLEFPGCFRCHDGDHASADGRRISHACDTCHVIVAQGPGASIEERLDGLAFRHPVDVGDAWRETSCSSCHDGALVQ